MPPTPDDTDPTLVRIELASAASEPSAAEVAPTSEPSFSQIVSDLAELTLCSAEEAASFHRENQEGELSVSDLLRRLVESGRLTNFQEMILAAGSAKVLRFGPYLLLDVLGKGGMGIVYLAKHLRMERQIAVKTLIHDAAIEPGVLKRFLRESRVAAQLNHPNIVSAFDAGEIENTPYLEMEYVEGQNLAHYVHANGAVEPTRAISFMLHAARGLAHAHDQGIIHRDIKPSNLLLNKQDQVKILDMGLARLDTRGHDASENLTKTGQMLGTINYMAPEQAFYAKGVDHRCDIYALGCTLFYLLAGKPPFEGKSPTDILLQHRDSDIPSLAVDCEGIPPQVDAVIQKMVAKAVCDRYSSTAELIGDLESLLLGFTSGTFPSLVAEQKRPQQLVDREFKLPDANSQERRKNTPLSVPLVIGLMLFALFAVAVVMLLR